MPRGDRTGPRGLGPMTGRAAGYCAGFAVPGHADPATRAGMQGAGRGPSALVSLGLDLLSYAFGRKHNGHVCQNPGGAPKTDRLVAAVMMDKCCFCGICQQVCSQGAITQGQVLHIHLNRCTGCGQCVSECPEGALLLQRAEP